MISIIIYLLTTQYQCIILSVKVESMSFAFIISPRLYFLFV